MTSDRRNRQPTLDEQRTKAQKSGFGALFGHLHETIGAAFPGARKVYGDEVWYRVRKSEKSVLTVLKIFVDPGETSSGLPFLIHAGRTETYFGLTSDEMREFLPGGVSLDDADVRDWGRSSPDERANAIGFKGYFTSTDQIDTFINGLKQAAQKNQD